jgi:hypothetical protein
VASLRLFLIAAAAITAARPARADRTSPGGTAAAPTPNIIGFPTRPGPIRRLHRQLTPLVGVQLEGTYVGTAQPIVPVAGGAAATLLGTAVEAVARASVLLGRLEPYAFAGGGVMRYRVTAPGTVVDSGVSSRDDVFEVPLGAGLVVHRGALFLDLRTTARVMTEHDLVLAATLGDPDRHYADRHQLAITATIGITH